MEYENIYYCINSYQSVKNRGSCWISVGGKPESHTLSHL